jgi:hypothetical protein
MKATSIDDHVESRLRETVPVQLGVQSSLVLML